MFMIRLPKNLDLIYQYEFQYNNYCFSLLCIPRQKNWQQEMENDYCSLHRIFYYSLYYKAETWPTQTMKDFQIAEGNSI